MRHLEPLHSTDYVTSRQQARKHDNLAVIMTAGLLLSCAAFIAATAESGGAFPRGLPERNLLYIVEAVVIGFAYSHAAYISWRYYAEIIVLSETDTSASAPPLIFCFFLALALTAGYYEAWPLFLAGATLGVSAVAWYVSRRERSPVGKICRQWRSSTAIFAFILTLAGVYRVMLCQVPGLSSWGKLHLAVFDGLLAVAIMTYLVVNQISGLSRSRELVQREIEAQMQLGND